MAARNWAVGLAMCLPWAMIGCAASGTNRGDAFAPKAAMAKCAGVDVAYDVAQGTRSKSDAALVFVHGWSCDRTSWTEHMSAEAPSAALRARRRIAIDLPGHGASAAPPAMSMDLLASAIAAVMDREKVSKAVLVGHSNGAPVIRHFHRRYPQRTAGLVAVDGPFKAFFTEGPQADKFRDVLRGEQSDAFVTNMVNGMFGPATPPERRERVLKMMLGVPREVRVSTFEATLDPAVWGEEPIQVPLMLLNVKQPSWNEEYLAYVRTLAPRMEYHEWEGVSHFLMIDDPARFESDLEQFLARNGL